MARRTLFEITAIVDTIVNKIHEERDKKTRSSKKEITEKFNKKVGPLLTERDKVKAQINTLNSKLETLTLQLRKDACHTGWGTDRADFFKSFEKKVLSFKPVNHNDIKNAVIMAGDEGADVIVKKVLKEYV